MQTPSFVIRNLLYIIKCCKVFVNSMFVFRQQQRAENPPRGLRIFVKDAHLQNFLSFLKKTLDFPGGGRYNKTRSPARTPREYAPVAQLDRVSDYESEGRGFESLPAHQGHLRLQVTFFVYITCVHRSFNDSLRKQAVVFKRGFPLCTAHGPRSKARLSPFAGDRRALLCRFTSQTPSPHPAAAV